jgi:hypothetical protein
MGFRICTEGRSVSLETAHGIVGGYLEGEGGSGSRGGARGGRDSGGDVEAALWKIWALRFRF